MGFLFLALPTMDSHARANTCSFLCERNSYAFSDSFQCTSDRSNFRDMEVAFRSKRVKTIMYPSLASKSFGKCCLEHVIPQTHAR